MNVSRFNVFREMLGRLDEWHEGKPFTTSYPGGRFIK